MSTAAISEECKQALQDLEDRVKWAILLIADHQNSPVQTADVISYLALSCRYETRQMDEECRRLMSKYEGEILNLLVRSRAVLADLNNLLARLKDR